MKTQAELQAAVDEIREVCRKHGVLLLGTCSDHSIFGEISIGDEQQIREEWQWEEWRFADAVTDEGAGFCVLGIGDPNSSSP